MPKQTVTRVALSHYNEIKKSLAKGYTSFRSPEVHWQEVDGPDFTDYFNTLGVDYVNKLDEIIMVLCQQDRLGEIPCPGGFADIYAPDGQFRKTEVIEIVNLFCRIRVPVNLAFPEVLNLARSIVAKCERAKKDVLGDHWKATFCPQPLSTGQDDDDNFPGDCRDCAWLTHPSRTTDQIINDPCLAGTIVEFIHGVADKFANPRAINKKPVVPWFVYESDQASELDPIEQIELPEQVEQDNPVDENDENDEDDKPDDQFANSTDTEDDFASTSPEDRSYMANLMASSSRVSTLWGTPVVVPTEVVVVEEDDDDDEEDDDEDGDDEDDEEDSDDSDDSDSDDMGKQTRAMAADFQKLHGLGGSRAHQR